MKPSKPSPQHTDAMRSGAFTGNLRRASLLPGEIAVRPPISQEIRAAAGTGGYPQPAGASLYQRQRDGGPLIRDRQRPWWHWPAIVTVAVLVARGVILALSDGGVSGL